MNLLVYNRHIVSTDLSLEAFAIRVGLLFTDFTFAIGNSPFYIMYKDNMMKLNEVARLRMLVEHPTNENQAEALHQAVSDLKLLRNKKNKGHRDIVFMKQTEKFLNQCFETYLEEKLAILNRFCLLQLAPLVDNEECGLRLWHVDTEKGEKDAKYKLSDLLLYQWNEGSIDGTDVMMLMGPVAETLKVRGDMTLLCQLPNLNTLHGNQLLAVREQLAPFRKELSGLVPMKKEPENGRRYLTGTWNLNGLKEFAERLQPELLKVPELEWISNLQKELYTELMVCNMETPALWQLLRDHNLLQDDTWEVLSKWMESGNHCAHIPIMTVTTTVTIMATRYLTEEESLRHRRKTINLD